MNTWTTVNCHPYVGVHTILDIWISVSQISKILGWLSWLSQFGDGKMKHFPAGILDVGWVLIHYVLISKGSQLWSGMAINSFLGGVKQKSLCSGFSADRAALEKLKYGLWTRICRFNSRVGFFCFFMQVPFMGWVLSQFIDAGSDLKLGFSLFVIVGSIHVWLQTPKHCQKWIC